MASVNGTLNGTINVDRVHRAHFAMRAEAARAIVEHMGNDNTERMHSSRGDFTPAEFGRRWRAEAEQRGTSARRGTTRCSPPAGSRFAASGRTGRPWTPLAALRGIHQTSTGSLRRRRTCAGVA
jgi:hypothetical protein